MAALTVALVGFEAGLLDKVRDTLKSNDFQVVEEPTLQAALAGIATRRSDLARPDLFAFGVMDRSRTFEALRAVRAHPVVGKAGILVVNEALTADEAAAVLDGGADDCYRRPFLPAIFCARVRGLLRRRPEEPGATADHGLVRVGSALRIHLIDRTVAVDQSPVTLSRGQFDLLVHLARAPGRTVPGAELVAILAKNLLYVTPSHVRRELEEIRTKLGRLGPMLELQVDGGACLGAAQAGTDAPPEAARS